MSAALRALSPPGTEHKLGLFLQYGATGRDEVPDPYYSGHDDFELVLDLAEAASAALLAELRARHALPPR